MKNPLEYYNGDDGLYIYVTGEIDHHNCADLRTATDGLIETILPKKVTLDLRDVTFCDSSGIAFILGRYKILTAKGISLTVTNVPAHSSQ
jgi:stage II sporulation protein AA (anti-sigma F factor antagonist)